MVTYIMFGIFSLIFVCSVCMLSYYHVETKEKKKQTDPYKFLDFGTNRKENIRILTYAAYGCLIVMLISAICIFCMTPETGVVENVDSTSAPAVITETTTSISTTEESKPIEETKPATEATEPPPETTSASTTKETTSKPAKPAKSEWSYNDKLKPEKNIFIYLTDYLGYSEAAACGIIGNIAHETGWKFDPDAGSPDYCYGLIQWMGGRLKKLKSWCKKNNKDYTSIQGQLDFMHWELKNNDPYGTYKHLTKCKNNSKGAYDAGWYFCYWYERPANKDERSKLRGQEAQKYYKKLVD